MSDERLKKWLSEAINEIERLRSALSKIENEAERLRAALTQFVACCDTAPPTSLMNELGMACKVARAALGVDK